MAAPSSPAIFCLYFIILCIVNGQVPGDLRLIRYSSSSTSNSYGRLQVYMSGGWGEVCGDHFNETERDVTCHQLGYISSLNDDDDDDSYGNVGDVLLSEVDCYGNSDYLHILRCSYETEVHNCQVDHVTLSCNTTSASTYNGQLRLSGGTTKSQGLVHVNCNGQWGTLCGDYYFSPDAAHLVCRQLGYTSAQTYSNGSSFGYPIWIEDLYCSAKPTDVCLGSCASCLGVKSRSYCDVLYVQCVFEALDYELSANATSCEHLHVEFRPRLGEVRLINETSRGVGVVQVVYADNNVTANKEWMNVCGASTNNYYNAITLCQHLGYNQVFNYTTISTANSLQMLPSCASAQPHILWCSRQVAYCNKSLLINCSSSFLLYYTGQVRLVGGDYPSEGRLEIYIRNSWGSLSGSRMWYFGDVGDTACRQLGYTGAVDVTSGTIRGNGTVWYDLYGYDFYYSYRPTFFCNRNYLNCFSRCIQYLTPYPDHKNYREGHYSDIAVNCTFDVTSTVSIGSRSDCEIDLPSPTPSVTGAIVGGVVGSLSFNMIVVLIIPIICCVMRLRKRWRRPPQAPDTTTGATGVAYTVQGHGISYVQSGTALPTEMVLVPAAQPNNRINPAAVVTSTGATLTGSTPTETTVTGATVTGSMPTETTVTGSTPTETTVTGIMVTGSTPTETTVTGSTPTETMVTGSTPIETTVTGSTPTETTVTGAMVTGSTPTGATSTIIEDENNEKLPANDGIQPQQTSPVSPPLPPVAD